MILLAAGPTASMAICSSLTFLKTFSFQSWFTTLSGRFPCYLLLLVYVKGCESKPAIFCLTNRNDQYPESSWLTVSTHLLPHRHTRDDLTDKYSFSTRPIPHVYKRTCPKACLAIWWTLFCSFASVEFFSNKSVYHSIQRIRIGNQDGWCAGWNCEW